MLLSQKIANALRAFFPSHPGGRLFYVDNSGNSKADLDVTPYATLQSAINACVANRGDLIIVRRGHAETMSTAATTPVINKAGITIRGEGWGSNRPTFTFSGTTDSLTVAISAADVTIENLRFVCDNDGLDNMMTISAASVRVIGCDFAVSGESVQWDTAITVTAAGDHLVIDGCRFLGSLSDGAQDAIELVGAVDDATIKNCFIIGDFSVAAISAIDNACLRLLIKDCDILNDEAGAVDGAIDLVASSTGMITGCSLFKLDAAPGTNGLDNASCAVVHTRISGAYASGGEIVPAADTL